MTWDKALPHLTAFPAGASRSFTAHKHLLVPSDSVTWYKQMLYIARVILALHVCVVLNKEGPWLLTGVPRSLLCRNKEQFGKLAVKLQAAVQFANH